MNNENQKSTTETPSSQGGVRRRVAILYSYWDDENYEVEIPENTDLDDEFFDWEEVLLKPLEDQGIEVGIGTGVSWGWK
jgi:hypothetical protein